MLTDVNLHDFLASISTTVVCLLLLYRKQEEKEGEGRRGRMCYVIWSNRRREERAEGVALLSN